MAGAKGARSARGKYTAAGYSRESEKPMYIARVPAGSAQDDLYDFNREGYRSSRPWNETPEPLFEADAAVMPAPAVRRKRVKKKSFVDMVIDQAIKEKKDAAACVFLLVVILMMIAAWGQQLVAGAQIQNSIEVFTRKTSELEMMNRALDERLKIAQNDERIRNLAQNELNMLRPERAQKEIIYIQRPEQAHEESLQHSDEPRMEMLDILLGLLNVFHIGE